MTSRRRPGAGAVGQLSSAVIALLALLPVLTRLPRVAVIACFESGHPLYTLTPRLGEVHCVSAPGPVIGWVLMVAGTALVHLLLLPPLLAISAWLARVLLHAARTVRSTLRPAITPLPLPMPAFVPLGDVRYLGLAISDPPPRANPRRGPPCVN